METHLALHAILIPALVVTAACAASRFVPYLRRLTPWLVALGLAAVAVRAAVVQEGSGILSRWPPTTVWLTAPACVAAVGIVAGLLSFASLRGEERGGLFAGLGAALVAGGVVLYLLKVPGESTAPALARTAILGTLIVAVLATSRVVGTSIFLSLAFPLAALAGLLILSGSAKLAITAGAVAFATGLLGLAALPLRIPLGVGGVATVTVASLALAAEGKAYDYDSFPRWVWLLPVVAPVAGIVADLPIVRLLPGPVRFLVRIGPPLVVAIAAVILAAWYAGKFGPAEANPYG